MDQILAPLLGVSPTIPQNSTSDETQKQNAARPVQNIPEDSCNNLKSARLTVSHQRPQADAAFKDQNQEFCVNLKQRFPTKRLMGNEVQICHLVYMLLTNVAKIGQKEPQRKEMKSFTNSSRNTMGVNTVIVSSSSHSEGSDQQCLTNREEHTLFNKNTHVLNW